MKKILLLISMMWGIAQAQSVGYWRYDTIVLQKIGGNSELKILNATKNVTGGVLTNMGNGRTAFVMPGGSIDTTGKLMNGLFKNTTRDSICWYLNGTRFCIKDSSGGASNDSLVTVARRYNRLDTFALNNIGAFKTPTSALLVGTSIEAGTQSSVLDSALAARITAYYGLTVNNQAASSRGSWLAASRALINVNPGHSVATFFTGWFNDWRRDGSNRRNQNMTINTAKSAFVNQMLSTYLDAGGGSSSITFTGSWTGYSASTVGGKSNGKYTQTSGDTLIYTFTGYTNAAFGVIGMDGPTNAGANFEWYIVNAATNAIVYSETGKTTNGQYSGIGDGVNDNSRGPMAFFKLGLTSTLTYKLKIVSKQSTNVLAVDYVGHLVDPVNAVPIVWMKPTRMDATGYAVSPNLGSNAVWNANNAILDSLYAAVLTEAPGYPLYLSETDDHFQASTAIDLYSDHIHLQDHGFYDYFLTIKEALPEISTIPSAGTFLVVNNVPYYSDGSQLISLGGAGGSGTPGGSVTQLQYNNAGAFGGIGSATSDGDDLFVDSLWGTTSPAGKLILNSTQHATKGEVRIDGFTVFDGNNKRVAIGTTTLSSARVYVEGNTSILGDGLLQMKLVTSQTGDVLRVFNAAGTVMKQILSTGAEMVGTGDWNTGYAMPATYFFINGGSNYRRLYNGSAYLPGIDEASTWTFKNNGTTSLSSTTSGIWTALSGFKVETTGSGTSQGYQASSGAMPAGAYLASSGSVGLSIYAGLGTGTSGLKVNGSYYNGAWKNAFEFENGTDRILLVPAGGNVGVATSTATNTLTVGGTIRSTAMNTSTTNADSILVVKGGEIKASGIIKFSSSTPTLTNGTNMASSAATTEYYQRFGDYVVVDGAISTTVTATSTLSQIDLSLPIASNLSIDEDLVGSAYLVQGTGSTFTVQLHGSATNDRVALNFSSASVGTTHTIFYHYSYKIL